MNKVDYKTLFESVPGLYLILSPDLTIITANDSYCKATMTKCEDITGRHLFDVFPDNPDDPNADGVSNLKASLKFVLENKTTHTMAVQKYDVRSSDGTFEERYWSPLNTPVLDANNEVIYIIHRVEDVTSFMKIKHEQAKKDELAEALRTKVEAMEADIFLRAKEIQALNANLEKKVLERTEDLSKSEQKYKYLFKNNPMPMWVIDLETFEFIDVNDAAVMHYGYSYDEFLSMTAYDIRPEEDKEAFKNFDRPLKISATDYNRGVWRHIKKDGTTIHVEIHAHEIVINGKPARFILSNDVTERIIAEKKLHESIKEISDYKYALDESSIIAISDSRGILTHVNDNFCNVSEYSREELIGHDYSMVNSHFHSHEFMRDLWFTIASGKIWRGELKNKSKSGTHYWVDATIVPFLDENGDPYQYVTINTDITPRKLTEDLLKDTGSLAKVGGWEVNLSNMTVRWTDEVSRIHGLEPGIMPPVEEAINFYAPEARPVIQAALEKCIATGEGYDLELPFITAQGKHLWVRAIGKADFEDGKAIRVYGVFQDITTQKEAKDEIQKLNEGLEQKVTERTAQLHNAMKELEAFSYSVSHDLRAPLRAVSGYAKILEEDFASKLGEEGKRRIDVIQSNAKNMGMLIDDLLAFSRLGRKELEKKTVDMKRLAEEAVYEVTRDGSSHAKIQVGEILPAQADTALLRQVFINLISNAVKYSSKKENALVEISSREGGDMIEYWVKDNGAGFDMQYVHKIFGIFERLHSIDEFEGTGVGLAIVQRIINRHGGEIWAIGKEGEGAEFHFTLPK
ncbi:MAG: PAS domain S-box protein [Bacteroidetes bacterium]|nr:PAS domain S-box protein [Bacteroidota bacterium]